jgi:hypothetical protein
MPRARHYVTLIVMVVFAVPVRSDAARSAPASRHRTPQQHLVPLISARAVDSGRWTLVAERVIQPPDGDTTELLNPSDLSLADDGRLAVVESRPAHVKVFGADGRFIRAVGRAGDGPGEFRFGFAALRADTLIVHDPQAARTSFFDARSGAFLTSRTTACCAWYPIGVDASGSVVMRSTAGTASAGRGEVQAYVRFRIATAKAKTVFVTARHSRDEMRVWPLREGSAVRMTVPAPMQPINFFAAQPDGSFLTGWSGEYLLRVTRTGRDTVALFGRPFTPARITSAEKRALTDQQIASTRESNGWASEAMLRAAFDPSLVPDTRPAYDMIAVDGASRRWVRLITTDTTGVTFDLFDRDGRWLDIVRVPASGWPRNAYAPIAWGRDHVAVPLEDTNGRPLIRIYRIVRR